MKFILTSAIIDAFFEERKEEYLNSLSFFKENNILDDIFIVETVLESNSFLENEYNVFYSKTHNKNLKNKGVKEILAIKKFLEENKIDENELIIKLTGRYKFTSNFFINKIKENKFDVYYKQVDNQVFFGCLAIKKKYLTEFIDCLDFEKMEKNMINIEYEFSEFLKNKNEIKKNNLEKIDLYSKINNQTVVLW